MAVWEKRGGEDYLRTAWSGGVTTQLHIAPEGARYADRDFLWRISSATVELEESDFTPLPDYERFLAILEGELVLTHNGGAPIRLRPLEVHRFSGADGTHSRGRCRDFNLMLRRGAAQGLMEALRLSGESRELRPEPWAEELLLFCVRGGCRVGSGERSETLSPGESLLVRGREPLRLGAEGPEGAELMCCRMGRLPEK